MIKAMMIVTLLSGNVYQSDTESMETCLQSKQSVLEQSEVQSVVCVPKSVSKPDTVMFDKFLEMFSYIMDLQAQSQMDPCYNMKNQICEIDRYGQQSQRLD